MAAPKRFFVEHIAEEVTLTGEELRHARSVLRLDVGDEVTLLDGSGDEYTAIIARSEKSSMTLHITGSCHSDKEPKANVYLLVGALKGDKTELVVQKAVELGVTKIGVFSSRYCAAYLNENKLERLNKVAHEAAKQCLRAVAPKVEYFDDFTSALESAKDYENKLFACEFLPAGTGEIAAGEEYALVVGSEGGFTEEEYKQAEELGFTGVSLGKRILRAETAAIALLSVVMYRAGELK
ncbi:MAG: 16S rRNA (uracil(1498)-N(3))-methyltransferase [Clostridiales bacterium]|nr:16S rRNA (uracil(1498)-N(3))-methyltransferase [Clostridiales bacterium]